MHEHWFMFWRQQELAFSGSALHFIQITWLIYVRSFCQHSQSAQVGSVCRMQIRPSDIVISPGILRLF